MTLSLPSRAAAAVADADAADAAAAVVDVIEVVDAFLVVSSFPRLGKHLDRTPLGNSWCCLGFGY